MRAGEPALLLGNWLASHFRSVVYLNIIPFMLSSPVRVCRPCQVPRLVCSKIYLPLSPLQGQGGKESVSNTGGTLGLHLLHQDHHLVQHAS